MPERHDFPFHVTAAGSGSVDVSARRTRTDALLELSMVDRKHRKTHGTP
jgi:hypothetical protein